MTMDPAFYDNLDLFWLPVVLLASHPQHRVKSFLLVALCLITLRTQAELIDWTGFKTGFLPIFTSTARARGMIAYSIIIALFLILAHYCPKTKGWVFFAITLSVYLFAFCTSMLIMAL